MKLIIKKDKKKGRGVYAKSSFRKGELIEECELLFMKLAEVPDSIEGHVFEYTKKTIALALGNGSLFNHSENPNAEFSFNKKKQTLLFHSTRKINPGEEITVDYGYDEELKKRFGLT